MSGKGGGLGAGREVLTQEVSEGYERSGRTVGVLEKGSAGCSVLTQCRRGRLHYKRGEMLY